MIKRILFLGFGLCVFFSISTSQYSNNQAASFDGTTSYVAVPNNTELSPTSALTIEAWIYPTTYNGSGSGIVTKNFQTSYWLGFSPTGRVFFYPKGGVGQYLNSRVATLIQLNRWTHLAATYNGTTTSIYINGVLDTSTTTLTGAIGVNTDSLFIGAERATSLLIDYHGYIDEVRLWSIARTGADIARDRFIPLAIILPTAGGPYSGIMDAWRFNGTVLDEAGLQENSGQARNISYWDLRQNPTNYVDYNNTLLLDGVNGYCATYPSAVFDATTAVTMEALIKRDTTSPQNGFNAIVTKGGATGWNYGMYVNRAGVIFLSLNGDASYLITATPVITGTEWMHIAGTYNSTTGKAVIYVNGDSLAGATLAGNPAIPNTPDSLFIGAFRPAGQAAYKFKGQIDQVRIWKDVARTRDEIRANMYKSIDFTTTPPPANVAVYGFDGRNSNDMSGVGLVPQVNFNGTARMTSAHRQISGEQTSPLLRDDAGGFGGPTYVVSRRHLAIPDNTPAGVIDSVFVSASGTATAVKLFVLLNHTYTSDLSITLTGPTGVSADVFTNRGGSNNDIMAVFDDNADSVAGSGTTLGFLAPFSPLVKPNNPLIAFAGTARQGWWKLKVVDGAGADVGVVYGWGVQTSPLVDVQPTAGLPGTFELMQNYPNPFNPATTIKFAIPRESDVNVSVYNILGQHVTTLMNDRMKAGSYSIQFNASGFSSGTYFYRITAGGFVETKKMMILK